MDLLRPLGSLRRVCFTRLLPQICAHPWSRLSCRFELEDSYYIFLSSSLTISLCFVSSFGFASRFLQWCVSRCKCLRFPGSNAGNWFQSLGFQVTWLKLLWPLFLLFKFVSSARRLQTWFTFLLFLQCVLNWNDCFCARGTLTSLIFIGIKEQRALSLSLQCRSAVVGVFYNKVLLPTESRWWRWGFCRLFNLQTVE